MQLHLSSTDFEVTPAMRAHMESTLQRVATMVPETTRLHVTLSNEGHAQGHKRRSAKIQFQFHNHPVVSESTHEDLYIAINQASIGAFHQIEKANEKYRTKRHAQGAILSSNNF